MISAWSQIKVRINPNKKIYVVFACYKLVCYIVTIVGGAGVINCLGHDMNKLTAKEEAFAQAYVLGGCSDATAAWRIAHPDSKAKPQSQHNKASLMLKKSEVQVRINELREKAAVKAENDFGVSVEWRLEMLKKIADAGMAEWHDQGGNARRENLSAARGAIQTINDMLGVALPGQKGKRKSFSVNLRIEDASSEPQDE